MGKNRYDFFPDLLPIEFETQSIPSEAHTMRSIGVRLPGTLAGSIRFSLVLG